MPIEVIPSKEPDKEPEYRITKRPGFEDMILTESSYEWLTFPQAVAYATERDSILQSAREEAAFRIEANGNYNADRFQATRTAAAYVKIGGKWCVAFDDTPEATRNIVLARAQEGRDSNRQYRKWQLPKNDEYVKGILSRAERDGRIVEVGESPLDLETKSVKSASQFGSHPSIQALLGDVSEDYAAFLNAQGYSKGSVYVLSPRTLKDLSIGDCAEIRVVGFGDDGYIISVKKVIVEAHLGFDCSGHARGVRHAREFSRK